ncbi:MAG: hypothetical protein AAF288_03205 [Planctomycetota bacterium]
MDHMIESFSQFGVAGLMGVLWVFERWISRKREAQLDHTHRIIAAERQELAVLVDLVSRNTAAIERFEQTEASLRDLVRQLAERA